MIAVLIGLIIIVVAILGIALAGAIGVLGLAAAVFAGAWLIIKGGAEVISAH